MRKMQPLLTVILCMLFFAPALAPTANAQGKKSQKPAAPGKTNPKIKQLKLSDAINDIKKAYSVDVLFEDKVTNGLVVSGQLINYKDPIESNFERILAPFQLTYKKIKDNKFLIIAATEKTSETDFGQPLPNRTAGYMVATSGLLPEIGGVGSGGEGYYQVPDNTITVTGVVKDDKNVFLQGVSVSEKGTKNTVTTKENGSFSIAVKSESAVLVFSYVGFANREVVVGKQRNLTIELLGANQNLDDVIVVGYGTQKKINNTGAVSTIGTKELVQSPVANISNSLVGRMPGLFATQAGGEPGNDASKIRIRGVATFSGNTDPLALVDGIQVDNYNNIDPNEIESVTILKDASSTAVYGIRGANGVIIITTKRGKAGPPKISYTFNQGFNSFTGMRDGMGSADYATYFNKAIENDSYVTGSAYVPRYTPADIELYRNGTDPIFYPDVDWPSQMFRKTSLQSQHNVSVSGGQKKLRYFISGGYFNQQGLFRDTRDIIPEFSAQSIFRRYNLRSNFNFDLTDRLKIALDLSTQTETRNGNNGSSTERVVGDVYRASPLSTPGVVDGKIVQIFTGTQNNPYTSLLFPNLAGGFRRSYRNYLNGSLRADYDLKSITKGLSIQGNIAVQTYNDQQITNSKTVIVYQAIKLADGTVNYVPSTTEAVFGFAQSGTYNRRITAEAGLNYKRSFGTHNVTGLLLYNQIKVYSPSLAFLVPSGVQSYVGRATYDFAGKYLAEINFAYNGTENFAPGKRFGGFPAYSVGWIASEESFFPKKGLISFLKFRASYGVVGNDNIGGSRFLFRPTSYNTTGAIAPNGQIYFFGNVGSTFAGYQGLVEGATGNPNVTWERVVKRNIAMETQLYKNKIRFTADFFDVKTSNILATPQTISAVTGIAQPASNLGIMQNKGYEFDLSFNDRVGKLNYRISGNYSFARNKVIYRDEIPPLFAYQASTGRRLGQANYLIADGLYNTWEEVNDGKRPVYSMVANNRVQPGDIRYRDVNGDGIVNDFDQVPFGYSNIPEITYGFSVSANYKGFDISVLFQGVENVSHYYTRFQRGTGYGSNPPEGSPNYMLESWTQERYDAGLPINYPRWSVNATPNNAGSTFWLADASYLRLKNTEIGYSLQSGFIRRIGIKSVRIYANANNLFTWSNMYPGIDPENVSTGDTNTEPYPLVRTINIGLNVNF